VTNLLKIAVPTLGFVVVAACLAGLALGGLGIGSNLTGKKDIGSTLMTDPIPQRVIPPLDISAPSAVETATFSLG
jgi:hypothetical protein